MTPNMARGFGMNLEVSMADDRTSPAAPEMAYTGSSYALHLEWLDRKYTPIATTVRNSSNLKRRYVRDRFGAPGARIGRIARPLTATARPSKKRNSAPTASVEVCNRALEKYELTRAVPIAKVTVAVRNIAPTRTAVPLVDAVVSPPWCELEVLRKPAPVEEAGSTDRSGLDSFTMSPFDHSVTIGQP